MNKTKKLYIKRDPNILQDIKVYHSLELENELMNYDNFFNINNYLYRPKYDKLIKEFKQYYGKNVHEK